jgi:Domain of unknown function (DUF4407)
MGSLHSLFSNEAPDPQPPIDPKPAAQNVSTLKASTFERFLLQLSGAQPQLVLYSTPTEIKKYAGIGAANLMTAALGWLSFAYALFTVSRSLITSFYLGLLWGLFVLNVDRSIVATLRSHVSSAAGRGKTYSLVGVRLLMALVISIVVSEPLVTWIFAKEIRAQLQIESAEVAKRAVIENRPTDTINELRSQNDVLQSAINQQQNKRELANRSYIAEAEGIAGTGIPGKGAVFAEKLRDFESQERTLAELKMRNLPLIDKNLEKINALEREGKDRADQVTLSREQADGLLAQLSALHSLIKVNPTLMWARFFISVLFVVIELTPVTIKLLGGAGPYDHLVEYFEWHSERKTSVYKKIDEEGFRSLEVVDDSQKGKTRDRVVARTTKDYHDLHG